MFDLKISEFKNLPEGFAAEEHLFVFTDIHSCAKTLESLLKALPNDAKPVFLGDAIDRGPDPIGTLEILMRLKKERQAIFCRGNHDALAWFSLIKSAEYFTKFVWKNNGGNITSKIFRNCQIEKSGSLKNAPKIFEDYWRAGQNYFISGNILMLHAGAPKEIEQDFLNMEAYFAMIEENSPFWWRPERITTCFETPCCFEDKPMFVISGHTPVPKECSIQKYGIMLDLGYQNKRAVEIRGNRFRTIDIECDEIY